MCNSFHVEASLARLSVHGCDIVAMKNQAASESLLLAVYDVRLPPIQSPAATADVPAHQPSVDLLQRFSPWILSRYQPVDVLGDGNCFFRALSYSLYGCEAYHALLRLLCVIEVLCNRCLYDTSDPQYYAAYKADGWLVLPDYVTFVSQLVKLNSYCDMLAVLAASSVTQKAIQTLWPLSSAPGELSPFTKLVFGRGLTSCHRPLQIMWTVSVTSSATPKINHFVPLIERSYELTQVIDCDAACMPDMSVVNTDSNGHGYTCVDESSTDVHTCTAEVNADSHSTEPLSGTPLLGDKFLSFATCINLVTSPDESSVLLNVPHGVKSNVCFLLSTADNDKRIANGQPRVFVDDCGAWAHTRGYKSVVVGSNVKELYERNGLVCDRKRVDGRDQLVPLDPQPEMASVRTVNRYDYKLKRCVSYRKRITIVSGSSAYLVEYLGSFPTEIASHGNSKNDGSEYVRTHPEVLQAVEKKCRETKNKPNQIFNAMQLSAHTEQQCPRNLKQVQNVSSAVTEELISEQKRGTNNLADEMLSLCSMVTQNDFVRTVTFSAEHAPCAILYTKEQMADVKRFYGAESPDNIRSVLCVDRTFNVSSLFLTLTVFKHMSVVRSGNRQPPIFLGPMFLHGDGSFVTYLLFFMTLRGALDTDVQATEVQTLDGMITGSDEEAALIKALRVAFPRSRQLYCVLHCRDNVRDHLTKTGVSQMVREELLRLLFSVDGLATAPDETVFEDRRAAVLQYVRQYCPDVEEYVTSRTIHKLFTNCTTLWEAPWLGPQRWTNNASESANNLVKLAIDWKPARLTDLVRQLHDLVCAQYKSLQRALIGQGDFVLADRFVHHRVPFCHWQRLTEQKQSELFTAFLADCGSRGKKDGIVTSTDGSLSVQGSNKVARKPGQRKRPRAERAGTHPKGPC